jgi:hypothetical protein
MSGIDSRPESRGDQSSGVSRTSSQRTIDFATRQGLPETHDFTEEPRERSLRGKLTGKMRDLIHSYKGSEKYNKTRFIERNTQKILELRKALVTTDEFTQLESENQTKQIKQLTNGIKDILVSCYRHSRHFDGPTGEFTRQREDYRLAYNEYYNSLQRFHESASSTNLDTPHIRQLINTTLTNCETLFNVGSSLLDALDTRINFLRATEARQFIIDYNTQSQ